MGTIAVPTVVLAGLLTLLSGAVGVIWYCVRRIISGDMVPRKTYADLVTDRDYWREAARESTTQATQLLEVGEFAQSFLSAIEARVAKPRPEELLP